MQADETLLTALARRATDTPDAVAFSCAGTAVRYAELWENIEGFAAKLSEEGLTPGERVTVVIGNSAAFFVGFYGVQRAGGSAVPLFPASGPDRVRLMSQRCGARIVVTPPGTSATYNGLTTVPAEGTGTSVPPLDAIDPNDVAFVQYTSGSTGEPKGVPLTHANLLTNARQMIAGMQITDRDLFVSWLPVYHDMGLILMTMCPMLLGAQFVLLSTELRDVRPWLDAISQHRGTFTAAPDFAYRLCLRHVRDAADYDLSSLRVALNAAEPVRASTVQRFEQTFGLQQVMTAGYGLAEATVGVSMSPPGAGIRTDASGVACVGPPFPEVAVWTVDGDRRLPPGDVGEIVVSSPANTSGYLDDARATEELFWSPGVIRTGDLGYVSADGQLYVVGREKNVIKRAGQTISPREVEEAVDSLPGVRYSAAIGIESGRPPTEQVVVVAETRTENPGSDLVRACVRSVHEHLGFRPARVCLVPPRTIPLTHNGKIKHAALRRTYLSGELPSSG